MGTIHSPGRALSRGGQLRALPADERARRQAISKKAIADRLLAAHGVKTLPETAESYGVQIALHGDVATCTLDTSGAGLSRRGYRTLNGEAPLRETLAAALLTLSPWRPGRPLHDPMCGTGTLLVEAAFMQANRAPGLTRAFACEAWRWTEKEAVAALREEARAAFRPAGNRRHYRGGRGCRGAETGKAPFGAGGHFRKDPLRCEDVRDTAGLDAALRDRDKPAVRVPDG